ncbi:MAG: DUF2304 domain-containing protein [Eggerthellaceae bacterium]
MTLELRVILIAVSLITLIFIARKVRSSKVKLEDSIFWFCFAVLILVVSIFPQIFYWLSSLAGTDAPVHFVFLFFIFVLLIQSFNLNMRISQADTKIKELTQQLAIEKFERYQNDKKNEVSEAKPE